eukprot:m.64233 g.64233  ORF g.64233 m.64233 type:complete len:251 (-) comp49703_c0_seq16:1064-1816(-)
MTMLSIAFISSPFLCVLFSFCLQEKFQNAKEGAVIVSSLNFCPLSFSITDRNLTDISTIMSVEKVRCSGQGVSWTSRPFDYYIHIIDRRALESFFKQNQRGGPKHRKPLDISEASSKLKELPLLLQKASSSNSLSTARRTKKEGPSTGGNETVAESEAVEAPTLDLTPHSLAVAQSGARKLNSLLEDLYATAGPLTTALSSSCLHERVRLQLVAVRFTLRLRVALHIRVRSNERRRSKNSCTKSSNTITN